MDWNYPLAEKVDYSYECAGRVLKDPYAWMEENNEKTKGYVEQQNAFTTSWFAARADVKRRANDLAQKAGKPGIPMCLRHTVSSMLHADCLRGRCQQ